MLMMFRQADHESVMMNLTHAAQVCTAGVSAALVHFPCQPESEWNGMQPPPIH